MPPKGELTGKCFYKAVFIVSSSPCSVTASSALATKAGDLGSGSPLAPCGWQGLGAEVNQEKVLLLGVPFTEASCCLSPVGETWSPVDVRLASPSVMQP